MSRRYLIPFACGLTALVTAGIGVIVSLSTEGWNLSGLIRLWSALPVAKLATRDQPGFRLRQLSGRYDGGYFYGIARDPLALGKAAHHLLPEPSYYWGHPAYGWAAWLLSGAGRPAAIPAALLAVGLGSIFVAGTAASLLASALGWSPWGGLVVALNPGLLFAVYSDTSESLGAAVLLLALVAYTRGRRGWTTGLLAVLCFDKEPLVLIPLVISAWEMWKTRRPSLLALAVVPAGCWWIYLRIHLGAFPFGAGSQRLTAPFLGWGRGLVDAARQSWSQSSNTAQLGEASIALILVFAVGIVAASVFAARLRTVVAPAFLALAALYACITPNGIEYPKDLIREVALVTTLLPFVFMTSSSAVETGSGRRYPRARPPSERQRGS